MTVQEVSKLYTRNVAAYVLRAQLNGKDPDVKFMREIEKAAAIDETFVHNFRLHYLAQIAALDIIADQPLPAVFENKFFQESLEKYAKSH